MLLDSSDDGGGAAPAAGATARRLREMCEARGVSAPLVAVMTTDELPPAAQPDEAQHIPAALRETANAAKTLLLFGSPPAAPVLGAPPGSGVRCSAAANDARSIGAGEAEVLLAAAALQSRALLGASSLHRASLSDPDIQVRISALPPSSSSPGGAAAGGGPTNTTTMQHRSSVDERGGVLRVKMPVSMQAAKTLVATAQAQRAAAAAATISNKPQSHQGTTN